MGATSIIYRREVGAYLRSPFTWVIAALFLFVNGILFLAYVLPGQRLSAVVLENFFMFAGLMTFGAGLLLSFRLIAEERQQHSMVLLNTSPVRDQQIIIGKFLAALTLLVIMLAITIYMPLLIKVRGKITGSQILVGYIGMVLVGSAALSIGLFASALVKNQFLAAVIALVLLVVLGNLFKFGATLQGDVRTVLSELDMWWVRYMGSFMRGVLNLKDVIYYLAVVYFFLLLGVKTLEAKRWQ